MCVCGGRVSAKGGSRAPFWASGVISLTRVGLLLIGDDGPDVADEESRGPEGMADVSGEGCWKSWVPSCSVLLSVGCAPAGVGAWTQSVSPCGSHCLAWCVVPLSLPLTAGSPLLLQGLRMGV